MQNNITNCQSSHNKHPNATLNIGPNQAFMTNFFDNQHLLDTIWKWRKHLIIVGVLAIILSAVFSSSTFITPKYRSTARVYPSNNIYTFSDESESEQLLEFINSQDIKLRMIDAFNLSDVYRIKKTDPHYLTYILAEFNDNVRFRKTEYETIEITVLDADPKRACAMCDSVVTFLDEKIRSIHRVKYQEVTKITKEDMKHYSQQIDSVETILDTLRRKYNILDYTAQAKEITKGMVKVLAEQKQNSGGGKELEQWLKNFSEKGGRFEKLQMEKQFMVNQLDSATKAYIQSLSGADKKISYGQIVQHPVVADKKAYPVRWLIVLVSTFASLFIALMVILVVENKKTV